MNQEIIPWVIATILYVVMVAVILVFVYKRFLRDDDVIEDVELGPMPQRRTQHTVWVLQSASHCRKKGISAMKLNDMKKKPFLLSIII